MLLNEAALLIGQMHYNRAASGGDKSGFAMFEALLGQKPFVLFGRGADGDHEQTHEERKQFTLWIRRQRKPLHRLVKAMVYIEPQPAKRFVAKASAAAFAKFWDCPVLVAAFEEHAVRTGLQHQSGPDREGIRLVADPLMIPVTAPMKATTSDRTNF